MDKFSTLQPPPYSSSPHFLPGVAYSAQGVDHLYPAQQTVTSVVNSVNTVMVQPQPAMVVQPQPTVLVQPPPAVVVQQQPAVVVQQQPAMVVQPQPVVMVQPYPTVLCMNPGEVPARIKCSFCQQEVVTVTKTVPGTMAWIICAILFFFLFWPFCLIPFCVKSCNDVKHTCPACRNVVHIYRRT